MKKYFFIFLCLHFSAHIFSQKKCDQVIQGKILDKETKEVIPYALIKVKGTNINVYSDVNGEFKISRLCSDSNILLVSCLGYCESVCEQHHHENEVSNIFLTQDIQDLDKIVIKSQNHNLDGVHTINHTIVDKSEIENNGFKSLGSVLRNQAGISVFSHGGNVEMPIIQGLYGNRILVLNNGFKHGFQNWGTDHAPEIDLSNTSGITIYKGAMGVRYGAEAMGGVVSVAPQPMYLNEPLYIHLSSGFQTNGMAYNTSFEIGEGYQNFSYFAEASIKRSGDQFSPDYILTNSDFKSESLSTGLRFQKNALDFKTYYSYVNQNLGILRASVADSGSSFIRAVNSDWPIYTAPFSYEIDEPNQFITHHLLKGSLNWKTENGGEWSLESALQKNSRKEYDVRRQSYRPIIDLDLMTIDTKLEWNHPEVGNISGFIGGHLFLQDNNNNPGTGVTAYIPNYNTNRYSFYLMENLDLNDWSVEAGLRFDYEQNSVRGREISQDLFGDKYSFNSISASLGFIKHINEDDFIRLNIGNAWRSPNMAEMYSFGQHGFKNSYGLMRYYFNEENKLKTDKVFQVDETSIQIEKGLKLTNDWHFHRGNSTLQVSLFTQYIQNYIYERPSTIIRNLRGVVPVFIFDQTDAFFIGSDLTVNTKWGDKMRTILNASYLWSQNVNKQEVLINQPPTRITNDFVFKTPDLGNIKTLGLTVGTNYTFRQFFSPRVIRPEEIITRVVALSPEDEIFDFKAAPKGYFLLDVKWGLKWNKLQFNIEWQNALNAKYRDYLNEMRYFVDERGSNVSFNLKYQIE